MELGRWSYIYFGIKYLSLCVNSTHYLGKWLTVCDWHLQLKLAINYFTILFFFLGLLKLNHSFLCTLTHVRTWKAHNAEDWHINISISICNVTLQEGLKSIFIRLRMLGSSWLNLETISKLMAPHKEHWTNTSRVIERDQQKKAFFWYPQRPPTVRQ